MRLRQWVQVSFMSAPSVAARGQVRSAGVRFATEIISIECFVALELAVYPPEDFATPVAALVCTVDDVFAGQFDDIVAHHTPPPST